MAGLNKAQLIEKIATELDTTKAETERFLDCFVEMVQKNVKKGTDVKLVGFGTFTKTKKKARMTRNPQTGKPMKVPAHWSPKFKAGSHFKGLVR